jgi:hypothetical protein
MMNKYFTIFIYSSILFFSPLSYAEDGDLPSLDIPQDGGFEPPGQPDAEEESKVSLTEGDWSFSLITSGQTSTSIITYYAGKTDSVVIVPSVLGGAEVTEISAQTFGHHSEIQAVYVPDTVTTVDEWAFYDLNEASVISFANPNVSIDDSAFQSSANATLYLPSETLQTEAGGKLIETENTEYIEVEIFNAEAAAIAGGTYLNVSVSDDYLISYEDITSIAVSGDGTEVEYSENSVTFTGSAYEATEEVVVIYEGFEGLISEEELNKTFRGLDAEAAEALNKQIANDSSYSKVASRLVYEEGYYLNGNPVELDENIETYNVSTGDRVEVYDKTNMYPSTGEGYYKYVGYIDSDNDGDIDKLYYSPYSLTYSFNSTEILSDNSNLNGLSARDTLNPQYLSFANAVVAASGESDNQSLNSLNANTALSGNIIEAISNEERSVLWADQYASIQVDTLDAQSTSVANWAKMSYESGLSSYNVELAMEWGMNALLYATNGGFISAGNLYGPRSHLTATGDGANGIIAGGTGKKAGSVEAPFATAGVELYNADVHLTGWNNHVADVVYGGYAYLEDVNSTTGIYGSYAVGQASALANDFGNGVVDAKNFHTTVYGNRSAGAYVIGGGVITAENSTFKSIMDSGIVIASGGTYYMQDSNVSGLIALRNRGGIALDSFSTFDNVHFKVINKTFGYTTGDRADAAVNAWTEASGSSDLIHYLMSEDGATLGDLADHYNISDINRYTLFKTLGDIARKTYDENTPLRGSVLDNTFYNYSAGGYTGTTDFSDVPYLTVGSAFGGLVSSVFEFEASGVTLELNQCRFSHHQKGDFNYLVASEAGSSPALNFNNSNTSGLIWNEGDVTRAVEGQTSSHSSSLSVYFSESNFTGSFADGDNGLWKVNNLLYERNSGEASALNGNYYEAVNNWGITATFDSNSHWTVMHDSYLGGFTISEDSTIEAKCGYSLLMTVDGEEMNIEPGSYEGEIVILLQEDQSDTKSNKQCHKPGKKKNIRRQPFI